MLQYREGDRTNPNHVPCPPRTPKTPRVYPPTGHVIDDKQEALFNFIDTLLQHWTAIQGYVGQGVRASEAGPSNTQDPYTRSPYRTRGAYLTGDIEGYSVMLFHTLAQQVEAYAMGLLQSFGVMDYFDM